MLLDFSLGADKHDFFVVFWWKGVSMSNGAHSLANGSV